MNKNIKYALLILTASLNQQDLQTCGIVGYVGPHVSKEFVLKGLSRLEYRGYDSAGICFNDPSAHNLTIIKAKGKLKNLQDKVSNKKYDGCTSMGHTRWATHGPATDANAHPHTDCNNTVAVVHNGIIENHDALKKKLISEGHTFTSDTDTEVIAHLFKTILEKQTADTLATRLKQATQKLVKQLDGSFALIIMLKDHPEMIITVRNNSPLTIGVGDGEMFIASDVLAYADKAKKVLYLPNKSYALVTKNKIDLYNFSGKSLPVKTQKVDLAPTEYEKMDHEHYMLKEIYEQPHVIKELVKHYQELGDGIFKQFGMTKEQAKNLKSIHLLGCGSSWHAGLIGEFFLESVSKIPTRVHLASEFRYKPIFAEEDTLYIAISQSGETADTLESMRLVKKNNIPVATITNVPSSSMVRETKGYLETKAGPEISVASTKAFTTQVIALYWLAHMIAKEKGLITEEELRKAAKDAAQAASVLKEGIEKYKDQITNELAPKYSKSPFIMCLGRHSSYPMALEGALKLKEITYIPTQGGAAGELKHGTLALVDEKTPVMVLSHLNPTIYKKTVANAQEIKAREGHLIVIAFEGQDELIKLADVSFVLPKVNALLAPVAMCGLIQFLAYEIAKTLGRDIDKPRNLAKSVTVE